MNWPEIISIVAPIIGFISWFWNRIDKKFDKIDVRFDKVDQRFEKLEERMKMFEHDMVEVKTILRFKESCMLKDERRIDKAE